MIATAKGTVMPDSFRRNWIQFSLRTCLWLMLCIALSFGAYRWGFDKGFTEGANQRSQVGTAFAKVYQVEDLLLPSLAQGKAGALSADPLVHDIRANVLPNTWNQNGGAASIAAFNSNASIVVSHDQDGHERIADYLEARRRKR